MGRFLTADPYKASAQPSNPQTWNFYSYVHGDPINNNDPTGQCFIEGQEFPDGHRRVLIIQASLCQAAVIAAAAVVVEGTATLVG
jgi:hypothetical protein